MLQLRFATGVRAGLVSAAVTAGAITGFGLRRGDWAGAFTSFGAQVLSGIGVQDAPRMLATLSGVVAHTAFLIGWGLCFAVFTWRREQSRVVAAAIVVAMVAAFAASSFVPAALGAVRFGGLSTGQSTLCVVLMATGLLAGRALSSAD